MKFPKRIAVKSIISSRYPLNVRPESWDERVSGVDVVTIVSDDGAGEEVVRLFSDGGQSPAKPGWVLLLTGGTSEGGYSWTLYGLPRYSDAGSASCQSVS